MLYRQAMKNLSAGGEDISLYMSSRSVYVSKMFDYAASCIDANAAGFVI